jgi:hypothetical protein
MSRYYIKKEKLKLKTASLDVWKKIYIEREERQKKNDEKYAITFTHDGLIMPKGDAR